MQRYLNHEVVWTNVFFLIPAAFAFAHELWILGSLTVAILFFSAGYHALVHNSREPRNLFLVARFLDISCTVVLVIYGLGLVLNFPMGAYAVITVVSLFVALVFFVYSLGFESREDDHVYDRNHGTAHLFAVLAITACVASVISSTL